jgi:hypothetical protein
MLGGCREDAWLTACARSLDDPRLAMFADANSERRSRVVEVRAGHFESADGDVCEMCDRHFWLRFGSQIARAGGRAFGASIAGKCLILLSFCGSYVMLEAHERPATAWEAVVLPLNYARNQRLSDCYSLDILRSHLIVNF